MPAFIIWGLRVIFRTLGNSVSSAVAAAAIARTGTGLPALHHRVLHPPDPADQDRRARPVPEMQDQVRDRGAQAADHRRAAALARRRDARPGHRHPPGRRRGQPARPQARDRGGGGAGERDYDDDALDADLAEPPEHAVPKIVAFGSQLQVEAREWYLAEAIRIALADGPLTAAERAATGHLAIALGMTQAQAIGVIALTEQNAGQN